MIFFEELLEGHFVGFKFVVEDFEVFNAVEPEIPEALAKPAPRHEQPVFLCAEEGKRFDRALRTFFGFVGVIDLQEVEVRKGELQY